MILRDSLTNRETEVLKLVAEEHTNIEIGGVLHISHKTVSTHVSKMMKKLDIHNRVGLARYAIREEMIEA